MRATLLIAPEQLQIGNVTDPTVGPEEVLIHPTRVGVCGSDVSFFVGHRVAPYPFILGHELVGRVVAVGARVTRVAVGQRVIVEPNYPCGKCAFCRTGRGAICPDKVIMGMTVPGCLADYALAPEEFVWAIPDGISDVDAATIEPLAVSLHAFTRSGARMGDSIAVIGCGATGLLLIQAAIAQGLRVMAHDQIPAKLDMARRFGAVVPEQGDPAKQWQDAGVTTVFECAGAAPTVELALRAAPRGSLVVLVGLASSPASFVPLRLVREGIQVAGSMIYDHPGDFSRSIALVAGGTLKPSSIVTDTFPLDQAGEALKLARTGRSGKIHIEMT